MTRLVLISDTHNRVDFQIPEGDILVHAGDLTMMGELKEVTRVAKWLKGVRLGTGFEHIVVIGGNHDWMMEKDPALFRLLLEEAGCIYLDHQAKEVAGLKFFGSGYTPEFYNWAYNVPRGPELAAKWASIPLDTQVLITHGPPMGRLDACRRADDSHYGEYGHEPVLYKIEHVGCADMAKKITELRALRLHVFGHIHHKYGMETSPEGVIYANASICDPSYTATNKPLVVDLKT